MTKERRKDNHSTYLTENYIFGYKNNAKKNGMNSGYLKE